MAGEVIRTARLATEPDWSFSRRWWCFLLFLVTSTLVGMATIKFAQAAWLTETGYTVKRLIFVLVPVGISLLPVFATFLGKRQWARFMGIWLVLALALSLPLDLIGQKFAAVACAISPQQCSMGHEWTTGAYYLVAALITTALATSCAWSSGMVKDIDTLLAERRVE